MIRLLTIIGARPQIIKAAAVSRAVREAFAGQIEEKILHTGQHYDDNMSEVFFRELGIPQPDYNLHVGSGTHGVQTGAMLQGIERILLEQHFDGMIVYGDTNSTLAGALAASKLQVPIFHVEAGLRSYNMTMPEEINRIVADRLGNLLFAPTETAVRNLRGEGINELTNERINELTNERVNELTGERFANGRTQKVVLSGDVMYDNSMYFSAMADEKSDIIERLGLKPKQFVLATIHRPANTDNKENLRSIFRALSDIASSGIDVVVPLHPRTRARWNELTSERVNELTNERVKIIEPASFFEIIRLEKNARVVMTDSGGVQKEAFFYGTPCVILRPETEWVEIVEAGAGILADADYERIMAAYKRLANKQVTFPPLFGDGHASEKILREIVAYLR